MRTTQRETNSSLAAPGSEAPITRAEFERLVARVERLERGRRPRDRDDRAAVAAVAALLAGTRFSAREVLAHTGVETELAQILDAAGVGDSPRSLGRLFRRCEGHDVGGWRLERVGVDRDGLVWRVSRV
jgi:hypothetical protein